MSVSVIVSASSPLSGWLISKSSRFTPIRLAYEGSTACSTSTNAARPPARCALAITLSMSVVLPLLSGPNTSVTRPRGIPPTPSARSSDNAPVGITGMFTRAVSSPKRMIEPEPYCFSMAASAACRFLSFSALALLAASFSLVSTFVSSPFAGITKSPVSLALPVCASKVYCKSNLRDEAGSQINGWPLPATSRTPYS